MNRHRTTRGPLTNLFPALAAVVASALVAPTALAATDAGAPPSASGTVIAEALAGLPPTGDGAVLEPANGSTTIGRNDVGPGTVTVPSDPGASVRITEDSGANLSIALPRSTGASAGRTLSDGSVAFPGAESGNSVIVAGHAVQMLTTLADGSAPSRYAYAVSLDAGQQLTLVGDGAAIVGADGIVDVAIGAPWATDASGRPVPTHYEVEGSSLVQVVDHQALDGVTYPVVADPIWLAPWVVKCLVGIGIKGTEIARIATLGSPGAIAGAFGRGAVACVFGK